MTNNARVRCGLKKRGTQEQCPSEAEHNIVGYMGLEVCEDCFNMSVDGKAEIYGPHGVLLASLSYEDRMALFMEPIHGFGNALEDKKNE